MFINITEFIPSELDKSNNNKYNLTIINNNQICWNSTYLVIQQAIRL